METLRAAVFDMDGLLIDSEPFWRRAQVKVYRDIGLVLTEADTDHTMGVRIDEAVMFWYHRRPWREPDPSVVASRIVDEVISLVRSEGEAMPGVKDALELLQSLGIPMALATSSRDSLIEAVLATTGLTDAFVVTCSAADEEFGKPHPAVFLTAAAKLGVPPASCLAFEDSILGVQAARSAGMKVIAVPAPYQYDLADFDEADLKLRSMIEFGPASIQRLFG